MSLRDVFSPAWRSYHAQLDQMDRELDRLETSGKTPAPRNMTLRGTTAWVSPRTATPGAPDPDLAAPESGSQPETEPEA